MWWYVCVCVCGGVWVCGGCRCVYGLCVCGGECVCVCGIGTDTRLHCPSPNAGIGHGRVRCEGCPEVMAMLEWNRRNKREGTMVR